METNLLNIWAKTDRKFGESWHPLVLHLLDVAAVADVILAREPESTRNRLAAVLGLPWETANSWILLLIACHDLGKACPGFQCKWQNFSGLDSGANPDITINHAFVSQVELFSFLLELGWPEEMAELVADAVGCHHGERASPTTINNLEGNRRALGKLEWYKVRQAIFDALIEVFAPGQLPSKPTLSGPDFMLLAGLTSFADWIGSNELHFSFGIPEDCNDLSGWYQKRRKLAAKALDKIGWLQRLPLTTHRSTFEEVFGFAPRPLQQVVSNALNAMVQPAIILVEAPMGEGKTEAALYGHLELQRRFGHRGLYVALPTKATGNAMFRRVLKFMQDQGCERPLDLQLLHGGALLNEDYQQIKPKGIYDSANAGDVRAGEWFTHKKRALLSEYGVGTIDQSLLTILPVRHQFVRLWGLANRVIVFDEIHAYDAYTGTLLLHLLSWLLALGSSVMLLSATLPPQIRRKLSEITNSALPTEEEKYPRLSVYQAGQKVKQIPFEADSKRRLSIAIQPVNASLASILNELDSHLTQGGYGLALLNTVQRVQKLYQKYGEGEPLLIDGELVGKRLDNGTEIYLFHARFPADRRQRREDAVLKIFGPPVKGETKTRMGRKILIATQVAEQSLDLDFDLIATDLAPIDLLLQRAGRLWRHQRGERTLSEPVLIVAGLAESPPPSFGKPLWWDKVYREDILLRTHALLLDKPSVQLPDEIDNLVAAVYEEGVDADESLEARLDRAMQKAIGTEYAQVGTAHQTIIGLPDDASWKTGARFTLYDDDEPGVHPTLRAKTRLGDDSIIVIPLLDKDSFDPSGEPDFTTSKAWFLRAMSLSRKSLVNRLRDTGVPEGWKKSALLRNAYPLLLDSESYWVDDPTVKLSSELGLVYINKETL